MWGALSEGCGVPGARNWGSLQAGMGARGHEPGAGGAWSLCGSLEAGAGAEGCLERGGASGARGYGVGAGVQAGHAEWGQCMWVPGAGEGGAPTARNGGVGA